MGTVTPLPETVKQKAIAYLDRELSEHRGLDWAIEYHRKIRLMLEEEKRRADFFTEYQGEPLFSLRIGIEIETEQALRALIERITELETK